MRTLVAVVAVVAVVPLAAGCGGGDESGATTTPTGSACESVDAPEPRDPGTNQAPSEPLAPGTTRTLTFTTNCGSFTVTLDAELAPNTTASLVALAEDGFYDETVFHRVARGFVIQGGDPTQSGAGGPGYSTVDVPPSDAAYTRGVVAMAKTGGEPAGTAGSQFFVVTGDDAGLAPEYAIVGAVTEGMETVDRIDSLGGADGPPAQPVVVSSVTVARG